MVAIAILGLTWCQHAGWMVTLYDAQRGRRLQITLRLEDALMLGQELARQRTERSGLYALVGRLLRGQEQPARVQLGLADARCATAALVLGTSAEQLACPTSTADGLALAMRTGLPLVADEALLEQFGVECEPTELAERSAAADLADIPPAFQQAWDDPVGEAGP